MKYQFPKNFLWGTSTAAAQIESASAEGSCHDWKGERSLDGSVLDKTIDHQNHRAEDAEIIASLGNAYRCGFDWSRLQRAPKAKLETRVVDEYRDFFGRLKEKNMHLMLVLHHFSNPQWFVNAGSWPSKHSLGLFEDYSQKMADAFGDLADSWNTFNEPCVYTGSGYLIGQFPPHKRNPLTAWKVLKNLSQAHKSTYRMLKEKTPQTPVGISKNTMIFSPEHILGVIPAAISDKVFIDYVSSQFQDSDFQGISYYGRIPFTPMPITELQNPGKLDEMGREHDRMWESYPNGIKEIILRFREKSPKKPIIITENGCCNDDDTKRIKNIREHLIQVHSAIQQGADVKGYFHWSTFDNHEWKLGNSYRFGLYSVDYDSPDFRRTPKPSAEYYRNIARNNGLD